MIPGTKIVFSCCLLLLSVVSLPQTSHSFYAWGDQSSDDAGDKTNSGELRGLLRGFGIALQNPDSPSLFDQKNIAGAGAVARLMLDADLGQPLSFEMHTVQGYIPNDLQSGGSRLPIAPGVERSDALDWSFANRQAHFLIDRLNMQYTSDQLHIKVGRQPVNLAATLFFTPNDFFAPFAAQTFYRSYKPGVDALRADIQFGGLSQLSLISVLAYKQTPSGDSGWSNRPDISRTSYLARASTVFQDFEWALLGGVVRKDQVIGGDFQGELFEWLGVRGEGHITFPNVSARKHYTEFSLALEHRWENTFTLQLEQFYHGSGSTSVTAYNSLPASNSQSSYRARHYTALGASYEFTALLTANATAIRNGVDHSSLLALYATYSLSDESELALNANLPFGKKPAGPTIRSEFGTLPYSFSMEARIYF